MDSISATNGPGSGIPPFDQDELAETMVAASLGLASTPGSDLEIAMNHAIALKGATW